MAMNLLFVSAHWWWFFHKDIELYFIWYEQSSKLTDLLGHEHSVARNQSNYFFLHKKLAHVHRLTLSTMVDFKFEIINFID
jgi:hypothetical protein